MNAIGVSWDEFWHMNPHIINLMLKGHQEKVKQQDYFAWLYNQYTMSAVSVAVEHCLAGKKAKSKYIRKPIMQEIYDDTQQQYSESKEECAVFEMKQRIKLLKEQNLPESPM
ncbi:MAG: hypothetical protein HFJ03_11870 [Lachnospira sp.]|nr:hypothetical protein [Lachnospira sp.]